MCPVSLLDEFLLVSDDFRFLDFINSIFLNLLEFLIELLKRNVALRIHPLLDTSAMAIVFTLQQRRGVVMLCLLDHCEELSGAFLHVHNFVVSMHYSLLYLSNVLRQLWIVGLVVDVAWAW